MERKKLLISSCISTFVICMIAHAYSYFNLTLNNDRYTILGDTTSRKYSGWFSGGVSEKWFLKIAQKLTGRTYLPWLDGLWTIVFLALSVFFVCEIFEFKRHISVWLTAGFFSLDFSMVTAHFYTPYTFAVALLFACLSVWIWRRDNIKPWIRFILSCP